MSDPQQPDWKPGQPPPWDQPPPAQPPPPPQGQWTPGQPPPAVPWTAMPQQQPPAKKGGFRFGGLIALVVVVGVLAGGYWLFRDRIGGEVGGLRVGDCFDLPTVDEDITDVQHQPCNEAHDAEVFLLVTDPAGKPAVYPLENHFLDLAVAQCLPAASTYLGTDFDNRVDLDAGYFYPTRSSWNGGDRGLTCYLHRLDKAKLTASLKGVGGSGPAATSGPTGTTAPSATP